MSTSALALQAIIFDVDGTLADTENYHRQAFNDAFGEFDLDWHWSAADYVSLLAISGGRERIREYASKHLKPKLSATATRDLALRMHQRKSEIYREKLVAGHIGFRDGVMRLINEARHRRLHLAIATSTSSPNVDTLLHNALGVPPESIFEAIVTSDIVVDKKPSPAVYQYALAELGLAPDECIAIEDTANGNRAARAAGLKTIITTHQFTEHHDFSGASLVVDQLGGPQQPFTVRQGNAHGARYVDIDLLEILLTGEHYQTQQSQPAADLLIMAK
ncbi:MAG: HAD-IA family hydrolase [Gammaproteobacteria bacterium]